MLGSLTLDAVAHVMVEMLKTNNISVVIRAGDQPEASSIWWTTSLLSNNTLSPAA